VPAFSRYSLIYYLSIKLFIIVIAVLVVLLLPIAHPPITAMSEPVLRAVFDFDSDRHHDSHTALSQCMRLVVPCVSGQLYFILRSSSVIDGDADAIQALLMTAYRAVGDDAVSVREMMIKTSELCIHRRLYELEL
jgi:hypothetical protein